MDKYHQTNPPTRLKSDVMGEEGSRKGSPASPCSTLSETPETDGYIGTHETHKIHGKTIYKHAECLERERNEARAIAKFWQEQYGHANPEHEWENPPWENDKTEGPAITQSR